MSVVGFHQARRRRQTFADRMRRDLAWPRPGGILVALAGAALVFAGALTLAPDAAPDAPTTATAPSGVDSPTTPELNQAPGLGAAVASESSTASPSSPAAPPSPAASPTTAATLSASGVSASPFPTITAAPALAISGAAPNAPIQQLFADKQLAPTDPALRNITAPTSPLVMVNKHNPLSPVSFVPGDLVTPQLPSGSAEPVQLRKEAATAAERLFAAAAADGVHITVKSSYRSYETQITLYNGYVADKGEAAADSTSARPGFSEHQTGLALDIGDADAGTACDFNSCFASTAAAQWVAAHGADYGFIVRYVPGKESVTGYLAEPWHLRYLGKAVAQDMQKHGWSSYEEYVGLPSAPRYK